MVRIQPSVLPADDKDRELLKSYLAEAERHVAYWRAKLGILDQEVDTHEIMVQSGGELVPLDEAKWLNCPWCADSDLAINKTVHSSYYVQCRCGIRGLPADSPNDARRVWNTRVKTSDCEDGDYGLEDQEKRQ